ncbi:MAG: histidine kinase [Bacteroidota bacterium]
MDTYALLTIITSIGCILLASFVYYRNKNSKLLIMFALGYALTGFYCFSLFGLYISKSAQEAGLWLRLSACVNLITPLVLHCISMLTQKKERAIKPAILTLIYVPFLAQFLLDFFFPALTNGAPVRIVGGWAVEFQLDSPWYYANMLIYLLGVGAEFVLLIRFIIYRGANIFKKRLAMFMLFTILLPSLAMFFLLFVFPYIENVVVRLETLFIFFVFIITTIGLFRYNIFDLTAEVLSRDIVANMSNFYILADKDANILEVNPKTTEVFKYKTDEMVGGSFRKIFADTDYEEIFGRAPEKKYFTTETYCQSKGNVSIPVLLSITLVHLKNEFLGYIIIGSDLSNVKRILEEKEIADLELKALQAQMNPHFLFNSLNTIQHFITLNDEKMANAYLSKFARLMRKVLDNSSNPHISLKEELDCVKLYLDLEVLRLQDKFNYSVEIDDSINAYEQKIPRMIIQPYLENAIWHGILPQKKPSTLRLILKRLEHVIECIIDDDGIGREKSAELNSKNRFDHQSTAMQNIEKRLSLLNKQHSQGLLRVQVVDKKDVAGNSCGTMVKIYFPV